MMLLVYACAVWALLLPCYLLLLQLICCMTALMFLLLQSVSCGCCFFCCSLFLLLQDAIVTWVKKKTGPNLHNLTTIEDAEHILTAESKIVLGFLDTLVGPESEEFADASKMEDDVKFYQTTSPNAAKLFHMDTQGKRPALVMIKEESEKINHFGGQFIKLAIAEFIFKNKMNLYRQRELEPTTRPANLEPSSYDVVNSNLKEDTTSSPMFSITEGTFTPYFFTSLPSSVYLVCQSIHIILHGSHCGILWG